MMKKTIGIAITLLLILLICINTVNAEDISINDTISLDEDVIEVVDSYHNHSQLSSVLVDSPFKAATLTASGGNLSSLQTLINSASPGDTIVLTGDYYWDEGVTVEGLLISKSLTIEGNGHTIDALSRSRVFRVTDGTIFINNVNFTHGWWGTSTGDGGGVIKVYGVNVNLTINHCSFVDNFVAGWGASIYGTNYNSLIIKNSYFKDNICTYGTWTAGGTLMFISGTMRTFIVDNCYFIDSYIQQPVHGGQQGAVMYFYNVQNITVTNSYFEDTACRYPSGNQEGGVYRFYSYNVLNISNNYYMSNTANMGGVGCGGYSYESSFWGTNTPNWGYLLYGATIPTTYVLANFTNLSPLSSGTVSFQSSLNTLYNSSSGVYSSFNGLNNLNIPVSIYGSSISPFTSNLTNGVYTFSIPWSAGDYVASKIGGEVTFISNNDLDLLLMVDNPNPSIGDTINYTLYLNSKISSSSPITVNFTLPSELAYRYYSCDGTYSISTGVWTIPTLTAGSTYKLNINAFIPLNNSLVGQTITRTAIGDYSNGVSTSSASITIGNRSVAAYTMLQYYIDALPENSTLDLEWDVEYNYYYDYWLTNGIQLNKTLTINGNNHTINGRTHNRIFIITSPNVHIYNLNMMNGYFASEGGAIYALSNSHGLTLVNSSFIYNFATTDGGAIRFTGNDLKIINCTFYNNSANHRGALDVRSGTNFTLINSTFIQNLAYANYAGALFLESYTNNNITGCTFINNIAKGDSAGAVYIYYSTNTLIDYCIFENNRGPYAGAIRFVGCGGYYNVSNSAFANNTVTGTAASTIGSTGTPNLENNWWGVNKPDTTGSTFFDGVKPETWVIMQFTTTQQVYSSGGTLSLTTTLNTLFNRTNNSTQTFTGNIPNRTVQFNTTTGSLLITESPIDETISNTLNYPATSGIFQVNSTIDDQILTLFIPDLKIKINVTRINPQIGTKFIVRINITNNGPENITSDIGNNAIILNFTIPSVFIYINTSDTNYNNNTGLWYAGNLSVNQSKVLNITLRIPSDQTLIGTSVNLFANATGNFLTYNPNTIKDNITITFQNKTYGSYIELQDLIDSTPTGGILNVPWDVYYDNETDIPLIGGMILNKTITLNGNGHIISGLKQARIFNLNTLNANVTLENLTFINGYATTNIAGRHGWTTNFGGAITTNANNLTIKNCTFINNTANSGGAIFPNGNDCYIINCTFFNNTATGNYGGTMYTQSDGMLVVINSTFFNNTAPIYGGAICRSYGGFNSTGSVYTENYAPNSGGAIFVNVNSLPVSLNYNAFYNNTSNGYTDLYFESTNNLHNWWGTNNPNFSKLTNVNPETWIIMNFTSSNYYINPTGGNLIFTATLNTLYNKTTGNYTKINESIPDRKITFNTNMGSLSTTTTDFNKEINTTLTYTSINTNSEINATIDNQTLSLKFTNVELNITNVTKLSPQIGDRVTITVNITNTGPNNITYTNGLDAVVVSLPLPSYLTYFGNNATGYYDYTNGLWFVGNLSVGQTKSINITFRIPFNKTLVGNFLNLNTTIAWAHFLSTKKLEDNITLEIQDKTTGSYTDLQDFIDNTPTGGVLNLSFNVTYDPIQDAWLQAGMRLNKSITLLGNGFTISGLGQARIFTVDGNSNVTIYNLSMINGYNNVAGGAIYTVGGSLGSLNFIYCNFTNHTSPSGGAIFRDSLTSPMSLIGCIFTNNRATNDHGGAIRTYRTSTAGLLIYNSTFINNSAASGGVGGAISLEDSNTNITYSVFENNTAGYGGAIYARGTDYINYNVFNNNSSPNGRSIYNAASTSLEYNWYGTNTPDMIYNTYIAGTKPTTYIIMNFTNTTPITYSAGTATLFVSLDTIFNYTNNNTSKLTTPIRNRTVYYNWTTGSVSPTNNTIQWNTTSTFTYPNNMGFWMVNATIDNQTLWIGSTDLGIYIISNKNPVNDGDNITINITIVNNGVMSAYDVNISIIFPYGFLINNYTNNSGIYNNTTSIWHFDIINPGENFTISFNGTLADPGEYLIINATIENNTSIYEENITNNTYILNVTVIQWSDLEITKNISNSHPETKQNITYIITVINHGPSTARNVTVFDNLSSKLIFQYYNSTKGIYNETTGIWFINNITPNSTEILNITVLINESGITDNFVNVSCIHNDTNWTNNYANISFETAPLSDLWVTINMEPQTSNFITFHIQAGNNGIENANGTIVEFNISSLMMYVNHTTDAGVYGCSTGVWDIGYLRVNQTVNMTLIAQLNFPAGLNVTNITTSVNITSWSTDLYPENNTDNVTFEAEIFGNFRLLQQLIDNQPANTVFVLPRSFAYDPINDAFKDTDTYDLINGVSIYKNLTIVNPDGYTIGGFQMARCLNITANNVILDGLKIADGYSPLGAGLNIPASNVQVLRTNFTNNVLWGDYGGAIYVSGNNVLIQDNYFERNNASKLGGAIGARGANNLRILNNTFINNTAKSDDISGGAIGILDSTATVNTNVFLDNNATSSAHIGSAIFTNNSNVNLEANWFGNNTPDMITDELIYGNKPETWIILDWEFVNPNMTGVELNVVFVLYNSTSGEKTPISYGLPYRYLTVTAKDPILSWYNNTYIGNNSVNYTYNIAIPVYQINATVDYETITLEFSTLLNVYKTLVNDTIWFGDDLIYNITIVNYGPHNTLTINVTDLLPSGLTVNSIVHSTGSTSQIGDIVYWALNVPAGTNVTLFINATPSVEGNYTNNITLNTSTPLDYFINGTNKTVTGRVLSLSDLEVNLTVLSPHFYVGENIVYNVRVANYGPSVAENIIVNMPVGSGLTYLYQDWPGTYSQATGIWNISSLNPGDILDINITFRINSPGWYNQTINITSDAVDTNPTNDNKTVSFNITNQVDLVLNMTINKGEALFGDNSVYITLNILNRGPSLADNVTIFLYHAGLDYWYATSGYGSFVVDTPTAGRWLVGTLNANTSTYIILRFVANTLGNFTINGRANNTFNDSNWNDNYANVTINVVKYADLSITKVPSVTNAYVG